VDDSSTDDAAIIAQQMFARVIAKLGGGTIASVRNAGAKEEIAASILVFLDADVLVTGAWF
jgi:hypothetical protein